MSEATPVEGTAAGEVTEGMTMEAIYTSMMQDMKSLSCLQTVYLSPPCRILS